MKPPAVTRHASAGPWFHEGALVGFSTLAILGAGFLTTELWPERPHPEATGILFLGVGLLVSLFHLGRLRRAPLALARVGRSPLSTEVALASATLAAGIVAALYPRLAPAAWTAGILALAFLASLGLVYNLPGQQSWRGSVAFQPLALGLAFGALSTRPRLAALLLAADTVLLLARVLGFARLRTPAAAAHPRFYGWRYAFLALRLVLADAVPALLLAWGASHEAAWCLALGILVDRLAFYLLAAQHTTEADVAAAERIIEGR